MPSWYLNLPCCLTWQSQRGGSQGSDPVEVSRSLLPHRPVHRIHHRHRRRNHRPLHPRQCRCLRFLHRFHRRFRPLHPPHQNRRQYSLPHHRSRRTPLPRRLRFPLPRIPPLRGGAVRVGSEVDHSSQASSGRVESSWDASERARSSMEAVLRPGVFGVISPYSKVSSMASPRPEKLKAIRGQSHSPSQRDASLSSIEISGFLDGRRRGCWQPRKITRDCPEGPWRPAFWIGRHPGADT